MAVNPDELLIFKIREEKGRLKAQNEGVPNSGVVVQMQKPAGGGQAAGIPATEQAPVYPVEQASGVFVAPMATSDIINATLSMEGANQKDYSKKPRQKKSAKREMSEQAAMGLNCVWHPWRPAFAICAMCHRPFCFDDIVEHNNDYYCLEDIDKVTNFSGAKSARLGNIAFVSAGFLMASFLIFMYFGIGQVIYLFTYIYNTGFTNFFAKMNISYGFILLMSIAEFLEFLSSITILLKVKHGFGIGMLGGLVVIGLSTYQYVYNTNLVYFMVIDIVTLIGVILLGYSKSVVAPVAEETTTEYAEPTVEFANVGRF
ncbi:MAG: hypothetical protein LVQ97_01055 [Candidatus Micrarchaeales archaeon]|jgi:hypothetical protein|uniref:Uncharacterized protein n=1 Tax=Candidatus Micrarchaeum acidiphilum ARMAN-2 TaxID=425595 RepID=C7DHT7_MICA2|nr:MAG: hypothetical protein UNLARM2_0629 [Candidatus Micrarchaeum acidiphilum ARMAN-2]MCW6160758.1 hypothetical protein [Candidatus Micrarchaeales archaeon]